MQKNDYRNTIYCEKLIKINEKKNQLEQKIKAKTPKVENFYSKVSDRKNKYNNEFSKIYNRKCAYCGVSIEILNKKLFEIDHFISKSSFKKEKDAHQMKNLIYSCYDCNRNKKEFKISEKYVEILSPDTDNITNVFYRDEKYNIKICDKYLNDVQIKEFYNKLKLDLESHRLDFLLMNIKGFYNKNKNELDSDQKFLILEIVQKLQERRNII